MKAKREQEEKERVVIKLLANNYARDLARILLELKDH
jgi:hypothetical protein